MMLAQIDETKEFINTQLNEARNRWEMVSDDDARNFLSVLYHHFFPLEERAVPVPVVITEFCYKAVLSSLVILNT